MMTINGLWLPEEKAPETLNECLYEVKELAARLKTCGFNWLTGCLYRAVLQAKIDELNGKAVAFKPTEYNFWDYPLDERMWKVK